jgi:methionyl-tRNA formyltransferase
MNKKKLVIISDFNFALSYLKESIIPSNIKVFDIITNKRNPKFLELAKTNKIDCKFHLVNKLSARWMKKNIDIKNSLVISAGSTWIIKDEIIKLLKENLLNIHQSPLPSLRGSVASYVKLFEIRAWQTSLHVIKKQLDKGKIVQSKNIFIGKENDTPLKINNLMQKKNRELLKEFLINYFIKKNKISYSKQNEFFSSYMPRLKAQLNGWIDWSLNVYELERFIGAFGNPYSGAKTMLHGKQVDLFDVELSCMEASRHPFENGMVIRKFLDTVVVSAEGGSLYIKKILLKKKNIISKIKPGDILYTKKEKINQQKRKNIFIDKSQRIFTNKKIKIKKI